MTPLNKQIIALRKKRSPPSQKLQNNLNAQYQLSPTLFVKKQGSNPNKNKTNYPSIKKQLPIKSIPSKIHPHQNKTKNFGISTKHQGK